MTHELTTNDNDGFSDSPRSTRGGNYLKFDPAKARWHDRDDCEPPRSLLVIKIDEFLRRWTDAGPIDITDKPLPDLDELNAAIPIGEWREGLDGQKRPPWARHVGVYLVDPGTAQRFIFASPTVGAHFAFEQLNDSVAIMRNLRGDRCLPLVGLASKPMKTKYKTTRPHFEILRWTIPGGEIPSVPQLEAPKPSVDLAAETLAAMPDVTAPTTAEIIDDDIPEIPF